MRIVVEQLNGETLDLQVTPEMTVRELKQQIKQMRSWEDELSRDTTVVELIFEGRKLKSEDTVAELGLHQDARLSVVFRPNVARCVSSIYLTTCRDLCPDTLVVVEVPEQKDNMVEFHAWKRLAKITIPNSVAWLAVGAFQDCSSLVDVTIPETVTYIRHSAFSGCSALKQIRLPEALKRLEDCAFCKCSSLRSISIPAGLTRIPESAFDCCRSLSSVGIPDTVTHIGNRAFWGCRSLSEVTIPDSVTHIGSAAFSCCSSLLRVTISSVTEIGDRVFTGCRQLTLTAPARLLHMGIGEGCKALVAKECECGRCNWRWFKDGWLCPRHLRSLEAPHAEDEPL